MADDARRMEQVLAAHVSDETVLRAMRAVPRELFLPPALRERAFDNGAQPIGFGQTISQPLVVARMTQALSLRSADAVLDVGTGSGYHAAVLAQLAASVVTIERIPALAATALRALDAAGARNVVCLVGDATVLGARAGTFDAINVAAAASEQAIRDLAGALAAGGRLVAPLRRGRRQYLVLVFRPADGGPDTWSVLEPVRFVPLVGAGGVSA